MDVIIFRSKQWTTAGFERYDFLIYVRGNSQGNMASISEIDVNGYELTGVSISATTDKFRLVQNQMLKR